MPVALCTRHIAISDRPLCLETVTPSGRIGGKRQRSDSWRVSPFPSAAAQRFVKVRERMPSSRIDTPITLIRPIGSKDIRHPTWPPLNIKRL